MADRLRRVLSIKGKALSPKTKILTRGKGVTNVTE